MESGVANISAGNIKSGTRPNSDREQQSHDAVMKERRMEGTPRGPSGLVLIGGSDSRQPRDFQNSALPTWPTWTTIGITQSESRA
ncbi:uncharacterized protein N7469_002849 [Penicillium citrinum]|uniref:Uncharacterized protein n=2 Tax=Penicillium TaxID=5073 RepID=A0A9W9PDF9_PENCI|nr:uncharacterized protein N7469_002849 [Penicillium citrinum]KAJ5241258.1 hypothetical protein N7469_002849 [Penicillium citrinum]KAJ5586258.1 hypothetical protein N7450_006045 [Penicillium hetheringtonii]KAK5789357.1 hypothetical protein VI817_008481 [Penicillium citrinum]